MISWIVAISLTIFLFMRIPVFKKRFQLQNNYLVKKFSIIIHAKNAEKNITSFLKSINEQIVSPLEVIVVDDYSEDKTKEIAGQFGARVIPMPPLPTGWQAKNWAYWTGAQQADGDIFLFVDSNTWFDKRGLLRIAEAYKKQQNRGVLTIHPYHYVKHWYETLSMLLHMIVLAASGVTNVFSKISGPTGGFEQCFICAKQDYFVLGGHETTKDSAAAHFFLSKLARKRGVFIEAKSGYRAISMRMYPNGFAKLINGWASSFANGTQLMNIVPFFFTMAWLGSLAFFILEGVQLMWSSPLYLCGMYVILALLLLYIANRTGNFHLQDTLLFPIHLLICLVILGYSIVKSFIALKADRKGKYVVVQKGEDEKLK
jgi:4,4'-diaponeurosporenoate glycosyltransferase